jgi:hypothetical protein
MPPCQRIFKLAYLLQQAPLTCFAAAAIAEMSKNNSAKRARDHDLQHASCSISLMTDVGPFLQCATFKDGSAIEG